MHDTKTNATQLISGAFFNELSSIYLNCSERGHLLSFKVTVMIFSDLRAKLH